MYICVYISTHAVMTMCACACLVNVICRFVLDVHVYTNVMYYLYVQTYLGFVLYTCMQMFVELSSAYTNVYTSYALSFHILLCATHVYKYVNDNFNYRTPGM